MITTLFRIALVASLIYLGLARTPAKSASAQAHWETVYDFLVQDVCVDRDNHILPNATPIDPPSKCARHRNLGIDEPLPYHKHDWPRADDAAEHPNGYQSNDTFPIHTRAFGTAVVQLRSFVFADGRPKPFEPGRGGGGVYLFSDDTVASGVTQDPSGLQFFYGPDCASASLAHRLLNAWVVVDSSFSPSRPGHTVARLTRFLSHCDRPSHAYTSWWTRPVTFRVRSPEGIRRQNFDTLISNHYGGRSLEKANNLERFYYTRELGLVRWERWQNLDRQERPDDRDRAALLARSNQCDPIQQKPEAAGAWVMVACRQYTNLVQAKNPAADIADSWLTALRNGAETRDLFGK